MAQARVFHDAEQAGGEGGICGLVNSTPELFPWPTLIPLNARTVFCSAASAFGLLRAISQSKDYYYHMGTS